MDIQVQSFLNSAIKRTVSITTVTSVVQLANLMNAIEGVDVNIMSFYANSTLMADTSASVYSYLGSSIQVGSSNTISELPTKEDKQKAKLNLAALKRALDLNPRATYDITELPTQYSGNVVIDNPNLGGLIYGRPWIAGGAAPDLAVYTEDGKIIIAQNGQVIILNVPVVTDDGFTVTTENNEELQVE